MDKRGVIQFQFPVNQLLGILDAPLGEGMPPPLSPDLKFQSGMPPSARPDHPVGLVAATETKIHLGFRTAGPDHIVGTGGAGFSPQGPGDGFQQRGFTGAIGTTDAGNVQAAKFQTGLAITEEIGKG